MDVLNEVKEWREETCNSLHEEFFDRVIGEIERLRGSLERIVELVDNKSYSINIKTEALNALAPLDTKKRVEE